MADLNKDSAGELERTQELAKPDDVTLVNDDRDFEREVEKVQESQTVDESLGEENATFQEKLGQLELQANLEARCAAIRNVTSSELSGQTLSANDKNGGDSIDAGLISSLSTRLSSRNSTKPRHEVNYSITTTKDGGIIPSLLTRIDDECYNMDRARRGICVIINQKNFKPHVRLRERAGTDVDAKSLEETFKALSFEVHIRKDLTEVELNEQLKMWSSYDHTACDAFVFCLLSHGERDRVYATDGKMNIDNIFEPFTGENCSSLLGKPKLFFIQACRGDSFDEGALGRVEPDSGAGDVYRLPSHADFLAAYSTVAGFYSWRNTVKGSWFIQALCGVLGDRNLVLHHDILSLLTRVNRRIAYNFESNVPKDQRLDRRKQMSCMTSTLTRTLFLKPKLMETNV